MSALPCLFSGLDVEPTKKYASDAYDPKKTSEATTSSAAATSTEAASTSSSASVDLTTKQKN